MRIIEVKTFNALRKDHAYRRLLAFIKYGAVFIYPTDTIYGIGCNALNEKSVKRIREIKKRDTKPFSVIAPSKRWIKENCVVSRKYLVKLPGKYTLICRIKKRCTAKSVSDGKTLGVRIPKHWISRIINELRIPIVTTSVNISGKKSMNLLHEFQKLEDVDICLLENVKKGKASTIIDITGDKAKIIKR